MIHGIDDVLMVPPETLEVINIFPGFFSTLQLGLIKTGLWHDFKNTEAHGGTFFAPTNFAFQKLGPRINAFLFSKYGEKYLKALLMYHVAPDNTLYSDAFYRPHEEKANDIPKGYFHVGAAFPLVFHDLALTRLTFVLHRSILPLCSQIIRSALMLPAMVLSSASRLTASAGFRSRMARRQTESFKQSATFSSLPRDWVERPGRVKI